MATLTHQAEDLWTADHELTLPGGVPFPARMTVVRAGDGSLALLSPIPLSEALVTELAALGPVRCLVAPNLLHDSFLPAAAARYPSAKVFGPPGLAAMKPGFTIAPLSLGDGPFRDVLSAVAVDGAPKIAETVFFHAPSRTLIVADLVFNVERPSSWKTSLLLTTTGTRGKLAQSRVWSLFTADARAAGASCRRILDWDFDRLIVAHGEVIASGAKARLAAAMTRTRAP